jgi:hypothetical protein
MATPQAQLDPWLPGAGLYDLSKVLLPEGVVEVRI